MIKTIGINKYGFIVDEENPKAMDELEIELAYLTQLRAWDNLKKGDLIIEVHDTCVSRNAGTPEQRFVPVTTVQVIQITRLNLKTYSYAHIEGHQTSGTGKLIKGYEFEEGMTGENGFRNTYRYFLA